MLIDINTTFLQCVGFCFNFFGVHLTKVTINGFQESVILAWEAQAG